MENKDNPPPGPNNLFLDGLKLASIIPTAKLIIIAVLGCFVWFFISHGPYLANEFAKAFREPPHSPDAVHARALTDAVVRSRSVDAVLNRLNSSTDASRTSLWQFQNGSQSLAGIPFLRASQTNVVTAAGVAASHEQQQGLLLQIIIDWVPRLLEGQCVDQYRSEASSTLAHLMHDNNIDRYVVCPVFVTGLREPAGFVSISYIRGWPQPTDMSNNIMLLRASAVAVGGVLSAYRENSSR